MGKQSNCTIVGMVMEVGFSAPPEKLEHIKGQIKAETDMIVAKIDKAVASYNDNKEKCNVAAWKVVDTNGDGKISLEEMLACHVSVATGDALFEALGVNLDAWEDEAGSANGQSE